MRRTAVYIDGYNLYYGRLRSTSHKWLDVVSLFEALVGMQDAGATVDAIKYFTAHALANFATHGGDSVIAQQSYHRALHALHGSRLEMTYGTHSFDRKGTLLPTFVPGQPYDRTVRSRVWKLEEKQTDVNIALTMYRDVAKGKYDQVVICSNDSDAEPALAALKQDFPGVTIGIVTPVPPPMPDGRSPRGVSTALSRHADWTRRYILDSELAAAQLPLRVNTPKKPISKPAHW